MIPGAARALSVKATIPVRTVLPAGTGMFAVKVTLPLTVEGLVEVLSPMVEVAEFTVWVKAALVLALKFRSLP